MLALLGCRLSYVKELVDCLGGQFGMDLVFCQHTTGHSVRTWLWLWEFDVDTKILYILLPFGYNFSAYHSHDIYRVHEDILFCNIFVKCHVLKISIELPNRISPHDPYLSSQPRTYSATTLMLPILCLRFFISTRYFLWTRETIKRWFREFHTTL